MSLEARDLTLGYDREPVVQGLDLTLLEGKVTAIVGANACGKSTLLRGLARLLKPREGAVLLDGQEVASMPTKQVARRLGLLPQGPVAPDGLTIADLVSRGRYPHQKLLRQWSREDEALVDWALAATGLDDLRERQVDELSGGQRQRAWLAMSLAQDTHTLLLDEPTTYLDLAHQVEMLDLLEELNERDGRTIVLVLHDLNQACRYAHHLVTMRAGQIHEQGQPNDIVDAEMVMAVYGVEAEVVAHPTQGTPLCVPLGRRGRARSKAPPAQPLT
ncbi:ABC transporter ATP-binding protein [Thermoleophilia bacterium SCSIO 60948]|nr:ABC transporter ATP-binding protein [Thermoleophilia bacterium SCSIO 60948]